MLVLPTERTEKARNLLIAAVLPVLPMCHAAQINLIPSGYHPCSTKIMKWPSGSV